ncbi:MAG TPA: hypothetical protein V6D04_13415, partial [Candidatus Obscuribacterales bacterium]
MSSAEASNSVPAQPLSSPGDAGFVPLDATSTRKTSRTNKLRSRPISVGQPSLSQPRSPQPNPKSSSTPTPEIAQPAEVTQSAETVENSNSVFVAS